MAGYADALASVLYPNSAASSLYTLGGKGITGFQLPTFKNPWQNALANAVQGLAGAGLQAYGIHSTNVANAQNAAAMLPELDKMGVAVPAGIRDGLASENPQTRALALALTEGKMKAQEAAAAQEAELRKFKLQEDYKTDNSIRAKKAEVDAGRLDKAFDRESKLRNELGDTDEAKTFSRVHSAFQTMIDSAQKDDRVSDIDLISGIAKIRDPLSAVREGEFKVNENTADWLTKTFGDLKGVVLDKGKLTPEMRGKLLQSAQNYWEASRDAYATKAAPLDAIANEEGLRSGRVISIPYQRTAYDKFLAGIPSSEQIRRIYAENERRRAFAPPPAAGPTPPPIGGVSVEIARPTGDIVQQPTPTPTLEPLAPGFEYRQSPTGKMYIIEKGK
jgi:hypothetical protein